jgi:hypothetical protein
MSQHPLEHRVARLEAELIALKSQQPAAEPARPWWKKIVGVFADNPEFEAAVVQGREYRESLTLLDNAADELSDLPDQLSQDYSIQEAILELREPIALAIQRHYTLPEIAQILTERGIDVSATELGHYLGHYYSAPATAESDLKYHPQISPKNGNGFRPNRSKKAAQSVKRRCTH